MRVLSSLLLVFGIALIIGYPSNVHAETGNDTGWQYSENAWYYVDPVTGTIKTGWIHVNRTWYYMDVEGRMQTGWTQDSGVWYYLKTDGSMKTGWLQYGGQKYYLSPSGAMQTGWLLYNGAWYYFNNSGAMKTGWILDQGTWYYMSSTGTMQTGWLRNGSHWYYLDSSGKMKTGWVNLNGWNYFTSAGIWVQNTAADELDTVWSHNQLILVTTSGYDQVAAKIRTFEKVNNKWQEVLSTSGYIGKAGFATVKKEGDQKSPRGKFSIGPAFGRYTNPGTKLPYRLITSDDVWVDDPSSTLYNTWQKASENNGRWTSAEKMDIPLYNYGFVINYNTENTIPGAGSAIFFHVGTSYTLGCTATSQENVISILKWLDPNKKPIIIQTPESELGKY
ncbi:cell wall-binding protein [Bacillus sp. BGMRC 2118]|nr:cell wall-binding protein [Bacillus sp. BGMRC 2118]